MPGARVLYLLCGLAFSGKSTLAAALRQRLGCAVVSLDEINQGRGLDGGDGVAAEEWARSHAVALGEVAALMRAGRRPIVVDDTNCYRFLRDDHRTVAERHGYAVRLLVLDVPVEEIRRRMQRAATDGSRRGLRPEVFEAHRESFEWPGDDEAPEPLAAGDLDRWLEAAAAAMGEG